MHARSVTIGILIGAILFTGFSVVIAWTGPTVAPPNGNVAAPLNVGTTAQVKSAGLSVDALAVFGNTILNGASRYLNFGTIVGSTGYGLRDNAGTMQFKNSSGAWTNIPAAAGVLTEDDPQVGTLTNGRWCTTDGAIVNCTSTAPSVPSPASTYTSCIIGSSIGSGCTTPACPSGYLRSGCSQGSGSGGAGFAAPSGSAACTCNFTSNGGRCYAYCVR